MTIAGPNLPTSASNSANGVPNFSSTAWNNVTNILLDDGSFATTPNSSGTSTYALCTNFGFSIPGGSTINGIVATVNKKGTNSVPDASFVKDFDVRLIKSGTVSGDNKADTSTAWSATLVNIDYGSSSDLWGLSFTSSDINDTTFGIAFSADPQPGDVAVTGSVDSIKLTVYYTASGGTNQGIMF